MKNKLAATISILVLICSLNANAQGFKDLDKAPHDISYYRKSMTTAPLAKVIYGRPQKKGQEIFGNLVSYDEIWRTGANEATEVKFYKDVQFGNVKVSAGTYVIYTIPGEEEWEIILSSNLDVLGAFQYDPVFNIANITVKSYKAEELESFSIAFKEKKENVQMVLGWDTTRVKIPITFKPQEEYAVAK